MTVFSILLLIGTFGLSFFAMARVKRAMAKYSQIPAYSGLTGGETAGRILAMAGISDVPVVCRDGMMMGDHYDPGHKRLVLSRDNYYGRTVAALGIAAHEAGHAIQHKLRYAPLEWRMASAGIANFASPLILAAPLLVLFGFSFEVVIGAMAIGFGAMMIFNLVTLPVEFDASRRAKAILAKSGLITREIEVQGVNRVLNAAALTYVAAFVSSLGWFLYHLLPLLAGEEE